MCDVRPVTIKICKLKKLLTKLDDMAIMAINPICYIFSFSIIGQAMHYADEKMKKTHHEHSFVCVCEKKRYVKNNYMVFVRASQKPEIIASMMRAAHRFQNPEKRNEKMKLENQFKMHEFIFK